MAHSRVSTADGGLARYTRDALFRRAALPLYLQRYVQRAAEPPHDHDFVEVVLVLSGSAVHETSRGRRPLRPGRVLVLRAGAWHAYHETDELELYNCCFGSDLLRRELAWTVTDPALNHLFWSGPLGPDRDGVITFPIAPAAMTAAVASLDALAASVAVDPGGRCRARHVGGLLLFLAEVADQLKRRRRRPANGPGERTVPDAALRGIRLLEEQLARPWTTRDLAAALGLNASYTVRLIKAAVGLPPLAYLARLRAERAAALLLRTEWPVSKIGQQVGWPVPYHFARRFRQHFGLTATAYRARFRRRGGAT
jgi:AraC family L-rhamnose operon transcriptional activator RhaR